MTRRLLLWLLVAVGCAAGETPDRPPAKSCGCFPPPTEECDGACYGAMVFESFCVMCHRSQASDLGPSLHGQFGTLRQLEDGRQVPMDEGYVRDSLNWPAKEIPAEWAGRDVQMPSFRLGPTMEGALIEYIESLRPDAVEGGSPVRPGQ